METGRGKKKKQNISRGRNPNHLKLHAEGIVPVSHTVADCFQCPHVESVSVAYFEGKTAFLLQADKPDGRAVKRPQTACKRDAQLGWLLSGFVAATFAEMLKPEGSCWCHSNASCESWCCAWLQLTSSLLPLGIRQVYLPRGKNSSVFRSCFCRPAGIKAPVCKQLDLRATFWYFYMFLPLM